MLPLKLDSKDIATIHYNNVCVWRAFKRWQVYTLSRKLRKLKNSLVQMKFEKALKKRALRRLQENVKTNLSIRRQSTDVKQMQLRTFNAIVEQLINKKVTQYTCHITYLCS